MKTLIETIESGEFANLGKPNRVVETLVSKLFFFGEKVYKVYKYNKAFYGDFSDDRFRHEFYHDDFIWNSTMAPDIYLKLGYVKRENGNFIETSHDESEDYYILMNKIDDSKTVYNLLNRESISDEDLESIISEMLKRVETLTKIKKTDMGDLFSIPYKKLELDNLESSRQWLYMAPDFISKKDTDNIIDKLILFVNTNEYFRNFNTDNYIASIDNHTGNIIFIDGKVNFIDSMPPMRIWRIQNKAYTISRPAIDIEVFYGKESADLIYKKYSEITGEVVNIKVRAYLQAVSAIIQAPYRYILNEREIAQRFWDFAKLKVNEL